MAKQISISRYEETIQSLFMSSALPSTTEANQILQRPTEPCHALPSLNKANRALPSLTNLQWIFASPTESYGTMPDHALPSPTKHVALPSPAQIVGSCRFHDCAPRDSATHFSYRTSSKKEMPDSKEDPSCDRKTKIKPLHLWNICNTEPGHKNAPWLLL